MKRLIGLAGICLLVLATAAQGEVNDRTFEELSLSFYGTGARALAMGNAGVGLANDITGATWNPAGAWVLERPMVGASFQLYSPNGEYNNDLNDNIIQNRVDLGGLGHFSFAAPVRIKGHPYVLNFNFNRNNEFTDRRQSNIENILLNINGLRILADEAVETTEQKAFLRTYSFGFSTRIYRQLSFGTLVNVYDGRRLVEYLGDVRFTSVEFPPFPDGQVVNYHATRTLIDSTTSNGFNFTLGAMYKLDKVSVGAVVRTPFQMKHSTDRSNFDLQTRNNLPIRNSDTIYVNDSIAKLDIPISGTVGIAVTPNPNFLAVLDASYYKYGSTKWYYREETFFSAAGDRTDMFDPTQIGWKDSYGVGGGIEYMVPTGAGKIPLRAGLRYDMLPQPKNFVQTSRPLEVDNNGEIDTVIVVTTTASDRQSAFSFSIGTGIHWSLIQLDFAYRYVTGSQASWKTDSYGSDPFTQTFKRKSHEFKGTFTGYF